MGAGPRKYPNVHGLKMLDAHSFTADARSLSESYQVSLMHRLIHVGETIAKSGGAHVDQTDMTHLAQCSEVMSMEKLVSLSGPCDALGAAYMCQRLPHCLDEVSTSSKCLTAADMPPALPGLRHLAQSQYVFLVLQPLLTCLVRIWRFHNCSNDRSAAVVRVIWARAYGFTHRFCHRGDERALLLRRSVGNPAILLV